jgi:hypothetical protein
MTDDHATYTAPSSDFHVAAGLSGPPTPDGRLYLATRVQRLGVKDRLRSIHTTPADAYEAVVDHAGESPPEGEPDWPDGDWGDDIWGFNTEAGATYLIQQFVWSGFGGGGDD